MNWKRWIKGIISALIGGAANGVTVMIVAPESFNFSEGFGRLGSVIFAAAIVSVAMYLKQSPLPGDDNAGA